MKKSILVVLLMALCAVFVFGMQFNKAISPLSNAYLYGTVSFNATTGNDSTNNMTWKFLQSNAIVYNFTTSSCFNITNSANISCALSVDTTSIADGVYTVNATAANTTGNQSINISTNVTVDNTAPSFINMTGPVNNSNITATSIRFNFSGVDNLDTILSCNLTVNGTVVNSSIPVLNATIVSQNYTISGDGTYNWIIGCSDNGGYSRAATSRFTIDNAGPTISYVVPSAADLAYRTTFDLTVDVIDVAVSSVTYVILNASNMTNNLTGSSEAFTQTGSRYNASITISRFSDGNYVFRINASDSSGTRTTSDRPFTVDTTAPTITAFTVSPSSVSTGDAVTATCGTSDALTEVSTLVTGLETSTVGLRTATCTATDGAGNTATDTTTFTVTASSSSGDSSSGGGSGGGGSSSGGASSGTHGASVEVDHLDAGVIITIKMPESSVFDAITITPKSDGKHVLFTVRDMTAVPTGVDELVGHSIYKYIHVSESVPVDVPSADIDFKVDAAWIATHGEEISLFRLDGKEWKEFKATLTGKDASYAYFSATVSGLSYYAIGTSSDAPPVKTEETTPAPAAPAPEATPAPVVKKSNSSTWIIVGVLIVLVIAGFLIWRKNR